MQSTIVRKAAAIATCCALSVGLLVSVGPVVPRVAAAQAPHTAPTLPPSVYGSSTSTPSGNFATLAMGHIGDPLETFWQLFVQRTGSRSFLDESVALAIATNGGLLLGPGDPHQMSVAARPSVKLQFTPVLTQRGTTTDWTPGAPLPGAATAFATKSGALIAIVGSGASASLVEASRSGSGWHTIATLKTLEHLTPLARCGPIALTAAAFGPSGDPMIGLACAKDSSSGLYELHAGVWRSIAPSTSMAQGTDSVLYLTSNAGATTGIICVTAGDERHLYGLSSSPTKFEVTSLGLVRGPLSITGMGSTPQGGAWITYNSSPSIVNGFFVTAPGVRSRAIPAITSQAASLLVLSNGTIESLSLAEAGNGMRLAQLTGSTAPTWKTLKLATIAIPYGASG